MYQVELDAWLPGTEQKVSVVACCKNINGYDVEGLTLRFFDENNVILNIAYDKTFFDDIESAATDALLDDYYNSTLGYMM
jgi:hypothetical protein